ncbi:uncharacterized protein LOC128256729 [Drosophila gunungcola]|uniref:Uncharacterized protein n=1 Tax=Drosophila gunungcola TaxID=103775 RepID=A0A9P9YW61_9MUSC|nr:uncharacterized protein LOC128256729 [Drosophila gunungcola]KAI8043993.1 hypothetical protein M5D96_000141 [Drosophila gunungcola]
MGNRSSRPEERSVQAYRNFLQIYSRQHCEMLPNDALLNAARVWGTFSQAQRMRYAQLSCPVSDMVMNEPSHLVPRKPRLATTTAKNRLKKAKPIKKMAKKKTKAKPSRKQQICEPIALYQAEPVINIPAKRMPKIRAVQPTIGFRKFLDLYQEIDSQSSIFSIRRKAVSDWCDLPQVQRGIFFGEQEQEEECGSSSSE